MRITPSYIILHAVINTPYFQFDIILRHGSVGPCGRPSCLDQWASSHLRGHRGIWDGDRQGQRATGGARGATSVLNTRIFAWFVCLWLCMSGDGGFTILLFIHFARTLPHPLPLSLSPSLSILFTFSLDISPCVSVCASPLLPPTEPTIDAHQLLHVGPSSSTSKRWGAPGGTANQRGVWRC